MFEGQVNIVGQEPAMPTSDELHFVFLGASEYDHAECNKVVADLMEVFGGALTEHDSVTYEIDGADVDILSFTVSGIDPAGLEFLFIPPENRFGFGPL